MISQKSLARWEKERTNRKHLGKWPTHRHHRRPSYPTTNVNNSFCKNWQSPTRSLQIEQIDPAIAGLPDLEWQRTTNHEKRIPLSTRARGPHLARCKGTRDHQWSIFNHKMVKPRTRHRKVTMRGRPSWIILQRRARKAIIFYPCEGSRRPA